VTADILERFDYAALGHIHKPMRVGGEVYRYCGTPLACSVSEAGQQKGIIIVELGAKGAGVELGAKGADVEADATVESGMKGAGVELGAKGAIVRTEVLPLVPLREVRVIRGTLDEVLAQGCSDYVTVILTDRVDLEVMDMQERLRQAFPYLLEIRRETVRQADCGETAVAAEELDPYELCCAFLKDLDEEEQAILRDVINCVQEAE